MARISNVLSLICSKGWLKAGSSCWKPVLKNICIFCGKGKKKKDKICYQLNWYYGGKILIPYVQVYSNIYTTHAQGGYRREMWKHLQKLVSPPPPGEQGRADGCWDPRALLISFCIRSVFCPLCLALPLFLAKNGFKSPWKNLLLLLLHVAPGLFKDGATGGSFGWESWHPL